MIGNVNDVVDFVYASYFAREGSKVNDNGVKMPPLDGSHIDDDRNNRRPDITKVILERLGSPDKKTSNILVTGSKGKGSVSRLLERILCAHGLKTGLFTSPHLHVYNERIRVNSEMISDADLVEVARLVEVVSREIDKDLAEGEYISPMGNGLAMALLHFNKVGTDVNILECGRGARFDDVAQAHADYAVINVIFDEHLPYLGTSTKDVAWHKAGVMQKDQQGVFSAMQSDEVTEALGTEAKALNLKVNYVDTSIDHTLNTAPYNQLNALLAMQSAEGILKGDFDKAVALNAINVFEFPGCLEKVSAEPNIYIDGCIHTVCAKMIVSTIETHAMNKCIVGIPDNKAYKEVVYELLTKMDEVILTQPSNCHLPFGGEQKVFANKCASDGNNVVYKSKIEEALDHALQGLESNGNLYVIGTQIYLGQVKKSLECRGLI